MMDGLSIHGLAVPARIGIHDWEQRIYQTLYIDIEIPCSLLNCQDTIEKTIDYARICQTVQDYIAANTFLLIETVASSLMVLLKREFQLTKLSVAVSKPNAIKNAKNIRVKVS